MIEIVGEYLALRLDQAKITFRGDAEAGAALTLVDRWDRNRRRGGCYRRGRARGGCRPVGNGKPKPVGKGAPARAKRAPGRLTFASTGGGNSVHLAAELEGTGLPVVELAAHGDIDFIDPALAYYQTSWQVEYATCVKLLNYPDKSGDAGGKRRVRSLDAPAAAALPPS